jgi:hypothetical protein
MSDLTKLIITIVKKSKAFRAFTHTQTHTHEIDTMQILVKYQVIGKQKVQLRFRFW